MRERVLSPGSAAAAAAVSAVEHGRELLGRGEGCVSRDLTWCATCEGLPLPLHRQRQLLGEWCEGRVPLPPPCRQKVVVMVVLILGLGRLTCGVGKATGVRPARAGGVSGG